MPRRAQRAREVVERVVAAEVGGDLVVEERIGRGDRLGVAHQLLDPPGGRAALPEADQPEPGEAAAGELVELGVRDRGEGGDRAAVLARELVEPDESVLGQQDQARHPVAVRGEGLGLLGEGREAGERHLGGGELVRRRVIPPTRRPGRAGPAGNHSGERPEGVALLLEHVDRRQRADLEGLPERLAEAGEDHPQLLFDRAGGGQCRGAQQRQDVALGRAGQERLGHLVAPERLVEPLDQSRDRRSRRRAGRRRRAPGSGSKAGLALARWSITSSSSAISRWSSSAVAPSSQEVTDSSPRWTASGGNSMQKRPSVRSSSAAPSRSEKSSSASPSRRGLVAWRKAAEEQVVDLVDQPEGGDLPRAHGALRVVGEVAGGVDRLGEAPGGGEVGEHHVAGEGEDPFVEAIAVAGRARDVELALRADGGGLRNGRARHGDRLRRNLTSVGQPEGAPAGGPGGRRPCRIGRPRIPNPHAPRSESRLAAKEGSLVSDKRHEPYVPARLEHARVHAAGAGPRPRDERHPRRGQRLPRPARRHDHRRDLPGGGHRHGGAAAAARARMLEENFARTVGSIGESVAAGAIFTIPAFVILGMWKFDPEHMVAGVPGRHRPDDPRRPARHHVRHHPAPRHGRGPDAAVPRVGGGDRDPQGRPARHRARPIQLFQRHGRRRGDQARSATSGSSRPRTSSRSRWARSRRASSASASTKDAKKVATGGVTTFARPRDQPGLPRRRLHHRPRARRAQLRRRPARLGPVRAAAGLLPRPDR